MINSDPGQRHFQQYPGTYPPQYAPPSPPRPKNGFGITALVVGLIGLLTIPVPLFGGLCGIVALVFGLLGLGRVWRGEAGNKGVAWSGTVIAGLAIVASVGMFSGNLASRGTPAVGAAAPTPAPVVAPNTQQAPPPQAPPPGVGDGTYAVGMDLKPGTYRTVGPAPNPIFKNCYWARLRDTSGEFKAIIANGNSQGPVTVTVQPSDGAFHTQGCQPWTKIK